MTVTATTLDAADNNFVLGETLRPLLTHAMGSAVEVFDTSGPAEAGPPPHRHPWEEVYVVLSGRLEVTVSGSTQGWSGSRSAMLLNSSCERAQTLCQSQA